MNNTNPAPAKRKRKLIDRLIRVKKHKYVILATMVVALIAAVATTAENLQKIVTLFSQASKEAKQIAEVMKEVDQNRDEIAVVARDANNARSDIDQVSLLAKNTKAKAEEISDRTQEISSLVTKANAALSQIQTTSDFAFLLASVAADDRNAFDQLLGILNQPHHAFCDLAKSALLRIVNDPSVRGNIRTSNIDWKKWGINPEVADFSDFKYVFEHSIVTEQPSALEDIWKNTRFPKFDRLSFLCDVLRNTKSVSVLAAACRLINEEAKINKNAIGYAEYIDWWYKNMADYAGVSKESNNEQSFPDRQP